MDLSYADLLPSIMSHFFYEGKNLMDVMAEWVMLVGFGNN
jgi:hypothetical protein